MHPDEFAQTIKAKYPQYANVDNLKLAQTMVQKYPAYASKVNFDQPTTQKPKKDLLQQTGDVVNSIFPGKQVGKAIGTLGGFALEKVKGLFGGQDNSQYYDISAPSPEQVIGDVAQGALTVAAPNVGSGATALGRIGANAALGTGLGLSNAVSEGKSGTDTLKSGIEGGVLGGSLSAVGEGVNTLSKNLPRWLTKAALPKLDSKNIDYAINNAKLGNLKSIYNKSTQALEGHENQIQQVLSHPGLKNVAVDSENLLNKAVSSFPNSEYTSADLIKNAKDIAPKVGKLLQKFEAGQANIQEVNTIRKELDQATKSVYTSLNRPPETKMLGAALANEMRDYVQTTAPATKPIFSEYAKEIGLKKALQVAVKKGETKVTFRDLVAGGAGFAHGGLKGALEAIILERGLSSPAMQLGGAKLLQRASKVLAPVGKTILQGGKAPLIKNLTGNE